MKRFVRAIGLTMSALMLLGMLTACQEEPAANYSENYETRVDFGAKFEPKGNYILHGAGQDENGVTVTFDRYAEAMGDELMPAVTMGYTAPHHNYVDWTMYMKQGMEAYGDEQYLFLQVGVHFNKDENPDEAYYDDIADGKMDMEIKSLVQILKSFKRPVFCRPGFEFNGQWNGYTDPEIYKRAFIRFAEIVEECGADNIALLWCYNPGGAAKDYMAYYPGDEYVDWWAIDIFDASSLTQTDTVSFLADAQQHKKPVMVTEATPKGYDITQGEGWEEWYEPFFRFVRENPVVKGTCYINWEWTTYPQWSNWGDSRIEAAAAELREKYIQEMSDNIYFHATDKKSAIKALYDCRDYDKS